MNLIRPARALALAGAITVALFAAEPVVTQAKKQIADKKYDEAITSLEAASKANPKSVEVKNTLVEALLAKADSVMADDAAPPRTKYPTALRTYRQVLTVDKDNKKAQTNIATIEGIYKSMGRPIPQ
ncbi:MAG: mxaK protein [Bryobacterales bacterium]|jgi:tetratricopeptide (TPR) repeat protein|nr:mxaK protein [Bryobacterales bacterium]